MNRKSLLILIILSLLLGSMGCAQPETKPETPVTPSTSPVTSPAPEIKPQKLNLIRAEPTKKREALPSEYLPPSFPWKLFKGADAAMHYPSYIPRKPALDFKVEVSANLGGELASPIVDGDHIILSDSQKIFALSRENGKVLWIVNIYQKFGRFIETYGKGKKIYLATSSTPGGEGKPLLIALSDEGKIEWRVEFGNAGTRTTSNMIVADGKVCMGTANDDGKIYCFSEEGKFLWSGHVGGNVRGMAYGNGEVYITSEGQNVVYAFDIEIGEKLWEYENDAAVGTPVSKEGKVFLTDSSGKIICLEKGRLLWKRGFGIGQDVNTNSFLAVGKRIIASRRLGERPLSEVVINFKGEKVGEFRLKNGEEPGLPLVTEDVVLVPATRYNEYSKVYLLWKGIEKLEEVKVESEETFAPKTATAYGEIYIVFSINRSKAVLYKLSDKEKPEIRNVGARFDGEFVEITADLQDERSAIYKALVAYSINGSEWEYLEMHPVRKYFKEPTGGYGLTEEPYKAKIQLKPNSTLEFYIAAIDHVGNHNFSAINAYRLTYI